MGDMNLTVATSGGAIEFRTGVALPLHEDKSISLVGSIDAAREYFEKHFGYFEQGVSLTHALLEIDERSATPSIRLTKNAHAAVASVCVKGVMVENPSLGNFRINEEAFMKKGAFQKFIRKNAHLFKSLDIVRGLAGGLDTIEIVLQRKVKQHDDRRGNAGMEMEQTLHDAKKSLPERVSIVAPIFLGGTPIEIDLQVILEASGDDILFGFECLEYEIMRDTAIQSSFKDALSDAMLSLCTVIRLN